MIMQRIILVRRIYNYTSAELTRERQSRSIPCQDRYEIIRGERTDTLVPLEHVPSQISDFIRGLCFTRRIRIVRKEDIVGDRKNLATPSLPFVLSRKCVSFI